MAALLEARGLGKHFGGGLLDRTHTVALRDFSLALVENRPSITAIVGESGSGKTTLARLLLGLLTPSQGEVRYRGQEHTVRVTIPAGAGTSVIEDRFHAEHERAYTFRLEDAPCELVTFHVTSYLRLSRPAFAGTASRGPGGEKRRRVVDFDVDGTHEAPVFERGELPAGFAVDGPAIVEEPSSTTLVHPGQRLEVGGVELVQLAPLEQGVDDRVVVAQLLEHAGVRRQLALRGLLPGLQSELVVEHLTQLRWRVQVELATRLPEDLDYAKVAGLSNEVRQKLAQIRPATVGQAARVAGVTPAAVSILLVHLKKSSRAA